MVWALPRKVTVPAALMAFARATPKGSPTTGSDYGTGAARAVARNMARPTAVVAGAVHPARPPGGAIAGDVADFTTVVACTVGAAAAGGAVAGDVARLTAVVAGAAIGAVALHNRLVADVRALTGHVPWTAAPEAVVAVHAAWGHAEGATRAADTTAARAAHSGRAGAHTCEMADLPAQVALPIAARAVACDMADVAA